MQEKKEYFTETLANGLRVVTVEMPHLHSAEVVCYVGVGGRNETPETSGVSHFLEHMVFRGTAEYSSSLELEQAFEAIGGAVNASTDAESTCFHSRVHPECVDAGMGMFASMLRRPLLKDIEVERRIILEEAMEDLNAKGEEICPDNLSARMLWHGSPLGMPTIGTRESIEAISLETLRRHHRDYYTPTNIVLAVAGSIQRAEVLESVQRHFGDWAGEQPPATLAAPPFDPLAAPEALWVRDPDSQVTVQLAFRISGRSAGCPVAARLIRRILSWGATSRLMLRLRENLGLTYNVEANLSMFEDCGCFSIDLATAPKNLVTVVSEALGVLETLCREPVPQPELERVSRGYLFDLDFSRDHTDEMAARFGWGSLVGYLRTVELDRAEISAMTSQQLHEAARQLFTPEGLKAVFVGPFKSTDRAKVEKILKGFLQG